MTSEKTAKRLKLSQPLIGTHNGHFHADEALAVYLLRLLPAYNPSSLVRTRDPSILSTCHTVVDVGGEYSPSANRFDHHQRTFDTTFPLRSTKLSSAGLVYLHFGKAIIALRSGLSAESKEVDLIWRKLYVEFVEALDANDNGISVYDSKDTNGPQKRFQDNGITLSSLVSDINFNFDPTHPTSDQEANGSGATQTAEEAQAEEDARFLQASDLMGVSFLRKLAYCYRAWLPSRNIVQEAYEKRFEYDQDGKIMVFQAGVPWKDHLYSFEADQPEKRKVLYVLYPESAQEGSRWRIQAVSVSKDSFESRKALPEAWRGVRDEDLDQICGVQGSVFVHASGFIGGNKTFEGAMEMAKKAIEL
ncbi:MAG: hypothetical protein Q9190_006030 [Brigantiaea leucoxantha]